MGKTRQYEKKTKSLKSSEIASITGLSVSILTLGNACRQYLTVNVQMVLTTGKWIMSVINAEWEVL